MMSRWFRDYAGMMRDEKLVRAAVRSKQAKGEYRDTRFGWIPPCRKALERPDDYEASIGLEMRRS